MPIQKWITKMQKKISNHSFSWEICLAILLQSSAALPWHNGVLTQKRWKVKMQKCIKWGIEKDPSAPLLLQKTDMNLFTSNCIFLQVSKIPVQINRRKVVKSAKIPKNEHYLNASDFLYWIIKIQYISNHLKPKNLKNLNLIQ